MNFDLTLLENLPDWLTDTGITVFAGLIGLLLAKFLIKAALEYARKTSRRLDNIVLRHLRWPLYILMPLGFIFLSTWLFNRQLFDYEYFTALSKIIFVVLIGWLATRITSLICSAIKKKYDIQSKNNLIARGVHTRVNVTQRIVNFFIIILSFAALFLLFDELQSIGVSLLASAGVAGLIIGFAAQKTLGNLLAGIQIAMTQPIRIDDAVVVEGEWGWIEEITLTYVVIKIWDWRRLVLPISYFIDHPFQNWTRNSADIMGSVFLYTDYSINVDDLRTHLTKILENKSDWWDGRVNVIQVTQAKDNGMELRILVSSFDSPTAWDLRCHVREEMVKYIQNHYPDSFPHTRATLTPEHGDELPVGELAKQKKST